MRSWDDQRREGVSPFVVGWHRKKGWGGGQKKICGVIFLIHEAKLSLLSIGRGGLHLVGATASS